MLFFLLLLVCLLAALGIFGHYIYCEHIGPSKKLKKPIRLYSHTSDVRDNAVECLRRVHQALAARDIPHWPVGGTLIGCLRHQGPIPWDNDVDIGVLDGDFDAAIQAVQDMHGKKVSIDRFGAGKMHRQWQVKFPDLPGVYLDIFGYTNKHGRMAMSGTLPNFMYGERFVSSWLFPLKKRSLQYGDLVLDGPNDAHAINNFLAPGYMDLYVIPPRHSAYRPPWNLFMRKRHASVKDVEAGLHD